MEFSNIFTIKNISYANKNCLITVIFSRLYATLYFLYGGGSHTVSHEPLADHRINTRGPYKTLHVCVGTHTGQL